MIGIQIFALLFVLWMTYFSYLHYRRGEFTLFEFIFWQILWVGLAVVVVSPRSVDFLLRAFSITRAFDLIMIVGVAVLYGVIFRAYVIIRRLERRIEEFTRKEALREPNANE